MSFLNDSLNCQIRRISSFPPSSRGGFPRVNDLKGTSPLGNYPETVQVTKEQVPSLVGSGSSGEADRQHIDIHACIGVTVHVADEFPFWLPYVLAKSLPWKYSRPYRRLKLSCFQPGMVRSIESLKGFGSPGHRMYAIRNRIDLVAGKHQSGNLPMLLGNPIDILTEIES